jgi:hypothetical protein
MKRFTAGLCSVLVIALVISFALTAVVYADDDAPAKTARDAGAVPISADLGKPGIGSLEIQYDRLIPEDNSTSLQQQNVGVKLYFNGDVSAESVQANNADCFKFTDSKDRVIPSKAYFDEKGDKGYILVTITPKKTDKNKTQMLGNKTKYKLTISGGLASADGKTLGEDVTLNYRTIDQSGSSKIYMLLMALMVVGMVGMTVFQNKRKAKAEAEVAAKEGKVNPYKLAKEKKITVQEAMDMIERDKKRRDKRLQKAGVDPNAKDKQAALTGPKKDAKRVSRPRPISEAGSTYKTGRKAIAEKKARENAERRAKAQAKAKAARNNNKKKGGKGKKK